MFRTDVIDHLMPLDLCYVNIFFGNKLIFHSFGMLLGIYKTRKCIPIKTFVYHIKCGRHSSKFNNFQSSLKNFCKVKLAYLLPLTIRYPLLS